MNTKKYNRVIPIIICRAIRIDTFVLDLVKIRESWRHVWEITIEIRIILNNKVNEDVYSSWPSDVGGIKGQVHD